MNLRFSSVLAILSVVSSVSNAFTEPKLTRSSASLNTSSTSLHMFDFLKQGKQALVKSLAGDYDSQAIQERLNGLISDNKAKEVLDAKSAKYTVVELDNDPEGKAMRAEMGELLGRTSVPAIWIDGQFVGGCNDGPMGGLVKLEEAGKLDGMLQAVGAI